MGKLTMKNYKQKMEKERKCLKLINSRLLEVDSWSRGKMLYELLNTINMNDLKYYIFNQWWDSIDSYHDYFTSDDIEEWLDDANVNLDLNDFNFYIDNKGIESLTVYRGTHEFNQGWDGLSWTTDVEVAKKFANGCGVRFQTKYPKLLVGKVYKHNIIGIFNDRNEKEILCSIDDEEK